MQRSITLATRGREPTVAYWTLALIGIVLVTLTFAALEVFLSGDESLEAQSRQPWGPLLTDPTE